MTNQVPPSSKIGYFPALSFPLLHAIFAKVHDACVESGANLRRGMRFGNGDQGNLLSAAPNALGGARDSFVNAYEIFFYGVRRHLGFLIVACDVAALNVPS